MAICKGTEVVWLLRLGDNCLMNKDSKNGRQYRLGAFERILKLLYCTLWRQDSECDLMAENSLTFKTDPVR